MADMTQLANEQAQMMGLSPVPVIAEAGGNASTDGSHIFYDPNFMSGIESSAGEAGLRFVLAHELGHIYNGMAGGHEGELSADAFAARSLAKMGLGTEGIDGVAAHLNSSATSTHPASTQRAAHAKTAYKTQQKPTKKSGKSAAAKTLPRGLAIDL